jgi:ClpP class serine protease
MIVSNMDPEEIDAFQRYYQFIDQLNQGLDLAAEAAQTHDAAALKKHFDRNRTKAKQLVDEEGTQASLYDRARAAVFAQLERLGDKRYVEWIKKKQRVGEKIEEPDEGATKRQPTP